MDKFTLTLFLFLQKRFMMIYAVNYRRFLVWYFGFVQDLAIMNSQIKPTKTVGGSFKLPPF
jgi:hypothetical protein